MVEDATPRKRMGRPPKAPEKGKRQNYTFRMSDTDRDKVIAAAEASGRSMSEEIERRIEQSFETEAILKAAKDTGREEAIAASIKFFAAVCGDADSFKFGRAIANALYYAKMAEGLNGAKYKEIKSNPKAFEFVDEFVRKCVTHELVSEDNLDFSGMDAHSIMHNLKEADQASEKSNSPG